MAKRIADAKEFRAHDMQGRTGRIPKMIPAKPGNPKGSKLVVRGEKMLAGTRHELPKDAPERHQLRLQESRRWLIRLQETCVPWLDNDTKRSKVHRRCGDILRAERCPARGCRYEHVSRVLWYTVPP